MTNPKLSFHLICQDEEEMIGQHIRFLLKLADAIESPVEFIIADGGSKDMTMNIINELKDDRFRVFENPWPGFAEQRNFVKSKSEGDWMFMLDADVVVSDSIYGMINDLLNAGNDIVAYSFPKIHLTYDIRHMNDKSLDPMVGLFRNLPQITWKGEGLESLCYEDVAIVQHPNHFNFPWQRYVPEVVMVHFAELKSEEVKVRKTLKYAKLKNSRWYGKTEVEIRNAMKEAKCSVDPHTKKPFHKDYAICLISKYFKDLKFYTEIDQEKEMDKVTGQYPPEYFDKDFFQSDTKEPLKGAIRGFISPHDVFWVDAILSVFGQKGFSFLDVGGGMGWVVKLLRERGEEAFGLDISPYAVENSVVREYMMRGDIVNVKFDKQYDIILCNRVLCYLKGSEEIILALANLKNSMVKYLIVAVVAKDHVSPDVVTIGLSSRKYLWRKSQWEEWFKEAGLKIVQDKTDRIVKPRLNWDCIWVLEAENGGDIKNKG